MISGIHSLIEGVDGLPYITLVINLVLISIIERVNSISQFPVQSGGMEIFCIGIPFHDPIYSILEFPKFILLPKNITTHNSKGLFKTLKKGTSGVLRGFLDSNKPF